MNYDGHPWKANRLENTSYIQFRNEDNPRDGMVFSLPDDSVIALDWSIRHAEYSPSREELFRLLAIVDSYRSLLLKPAKEQRVIARTLRIFLMQNTSRQTPAASKGQVNG